MQDLPDLENPTGLHECLCVIVHIINGAQRVDRCRAPAVGADQPFCLNARTTDTTVRRRSCRSLSEGLRENPWKGNHHWRRVVYALVSFVLHPVQFYQDWRNYRQVNAYRRPKAIRAHNQSDYDCLFWSGGNPNADARCSVCRPVPAGD